jgi:hypothetical protein
LHHFSGVVLDSDHRGSAKVVRMLKHQLESFSPRFLAQILEQRDVPSTQSLE